MREVKREGRNREGTRKGEKEVREEEIERERNNFSKFIYLQCGQCLESFPLA